VFQRIKNNIGWLVLIALALGATFICLAVFGRILSGGLMVEFLDVGQGSSALILAPEGKQVLIDGGPGDTVLARLGEEMPLFDKKIELVILTHPDSDHISGLIEVLKRYGVEQILETGIADNTAEYKEWNDLIAQKNIPVIFAAVGQKIKIAQNLELDILYPFGKINGQDFSDKTNASSIVAKLIYGQNSFLFTGDAEKDTEWILDFSQIDLRADILVVGHHGSKNSTTAEFLAAVAPRLAVISVGAKNKYGHPAPEILERLKGLDILRTDLAGNINFSCDLDKCQQVR
jgi:competence protein ComEC